MADESVRPNFDLKMTYNEDLDVDIHVEYPKDQALAAFSALRDIGRVEYLNQLLFEFREDASVNEALTLAGLLPEDDTEETFDESFYEEHPNG